MAVISIKNKTKSGSLLNGNAPFIPTDFESIETITASGGETSISFTSIPSTYQHLQIRFTANASTNDNYMRFNSDTGNNYSWHNIYGDGSSAAVYTPGASQNKVSAGYGSINASTSYTGSAVCDILDYANVNKYKTTRSLSGYDENGSGYILFHSGLWMNTNAISTITIFPGSGSIKQYSKYALYGIKG
jgi:hypothetical protein